MNLIRIKNTHKNNNNTTNNINENNNKIKIKNIIMYKIIQTLCR